MGALAAVRRAPARRASPAGGVQRGTTQPAGHAVRWPDLDGLPGFGGGAGGPAAFVVVGVPAGTGAPADGGAFGDDLPAPLAHFLGRGGGRPGGFRRSRRSGRYRSTSGRSGLW